MAEKQPLPANKPKELTQAPEFPINKKAVDETGFLVNGKAHETVHNALTCHCLVHENQAWITIWNQGILNPKQRYDTFKKYEKVAGELHQIRFGKKQEITIADFTK